MKLIDTELHKENSRLIMIEEESDGKIAEWKMKNGRRWKVGKTESHELN